MGFEVEVTPRLVDESRIPWFHKSKFDVML